MPHKYRSYDSPSGATSTVTGNWVDTGASIADVYVHIDITGTAEVIIEASMDAVNAIAVSDPIAASTVWVLTGRIPYYRCRVSSWSSGTVSCRFGPAMGHHEEMSNVGPPLQSSGGPS